MRGGESHSGSHSPYSKLWRNTGGGALLRLGSHPVGAMLYLKRVEGLRRGGQPIRPLRVSAETADLTRTLGLDLSAARIATGWVDVENWGSLILEFEDGSRGVAWGSDNQLGGMESRLDLFASNCRLQCNLSPGDLLRAYAPDGEVFGDSYIMEKIDSGAGWTTPMPDEDWTSGQLGMLHTFARHLRQGSTPESGGELGLDVVRVLYGAYLSAEQGRRIDL
jgi:predicted dehydrogenase